jgi:dTDP-4-amino-4,6-dideoxygalactose transaminase
VAVPLVDLHAQYVTVREEIDAAIDAVLASGAFVHGPFAQSFEREFAAYCGAEHAIGVANGTDALLLALRALGVGPGDEVITTPFTFTATAEAIVLCGATPRFVDVDAHTRNLNPDLLECAISPRTRAIIPVHLYGLPADMYSVCEVARQHGLAVIEDAAQAHGAKCGKRRVGSFGDAACFSFYPSKNLGAFGDAGAVVCSDPSLADRVRMLADHGRVNRYEHQLVGVNSRLDGMQAAILSVKLRHLDRWNERRNQIAQQYTESLADLPEVRLPQTPADIYAVYHVFAMEAADRDNLVAHLQRNHVAASVHYPVPLHMQPAYRGLGIQPGAYPESERIADSIVSLPIYPELASETVGSICELVRSFYRRGAHR